MFHFIQYSKRYKYNIFISLFGKRKEREKSIELINVLYFAKN